MNYFGEPTPLTTTLVVEAHKMNKAFVVAAGAVINEAQPVKLDADGNITPLLAADLPHLILGHSIHNSPKGDVFTGEITITCRGHLKIRAQSGGAIVPGPVKFASYDTVKKVNVYVQAADAATTQGHATIKASAAGQEIEVILL
jgi:hypothetical protein